MTGVDPAAGRVDPARLAALAERALAHLPGEAQVSVVAERSLVSRFARSQATQATAVEDVSVELLCVHAGHPVTVTVNALDDDTLRAGAGYAVAAARAAAREGPGHHPGLPDPARAATHAGYDRRTAQLDPEQAGAALSAIFEAAAERGLEAFGVWSVGEVHTAIASARGIRVQDAVTDAFLKVICRDSRGRSGFAASTSVAADVDARALTLMAADKVSAREPAGLAPGEYTVVLAPDAVGTLLEFLGDLAFNGLAHAEGRGALSGRLGSTVAAPAINLADAPRHPRTLPRAFDAEGVPKAPIPLIQDGVAHAVVHDTRSAARAGSGARSTGHALAPGGAPDGPGPTNLVLGGGGARDEAELIAGVPRGLYVTRLWYVNAVHERRTLLTGVTRDGTFLIEDGRLTRPLADQRFTDSVLRILSATDALGARQRLVSEGEAYGRRSATGVVCPPLRANGFRITGAAG